MTFKNSDQNYAWLRAKRISDEVGFDENDKAVSESILARLHTDPTTVSHLEPPAGYENHLVESLMLKASREIKSQEGHSHSRESTQVMWFQRPMFLQLSGVFSVLVIAILFFATTRTKSDSKASAEQDLWAKAVKDAPKVAVSRWLASVSDGSSQSLLMSGDLSLAAHGLDKRKLLKLIEESPGS